MSVNAWHGENFYIIISSGIHVNLVLQSTVILLLSFVYELFLFFFLQIPLFSYRLYILSDLFLEKNPSRLQIWILCFITYALISVPIVSFSF